MKKLSLAIICLFLFTYAQAQFAVNPKVGVNFSRIAGESVNLSDDGLRAGLNAGVDFRISGEDSWVFFQPGLHYYNVGSRFTANTSGNVDDDGTGTGSGSLEVEDALTVHSIRIPLNAGIYITSPEGASHVRLNAGITPSFILGVGENELSIEGDDFNRLNWGLNGGIGFDFTVVTLDFNYEHGLASVLDNVEEIEDSDIDGRNRIFTISVGIILPPK